MTGLSVGRLDEEVGYGVASAEDYVTLVPFPGTVGPYHDHLFFLVIHGPAVSLAMQAIGSQLRRPNRVDRCT